MGTNNSISLPLTKKLVVLWLTELKIPKGLVAAYTHIDSLTNLCLENEAAVVDKPLTPLYKNVAQTMLLELPVNSIKTIIYSYYLYVNFYVCTACLLKIC